MQNVHAMRPETRADYERALEHVAGDAAFAVRLERWFGELRAPLVAVYGADARFPAAWTALLEAIAAVAAARPADLRALDHEREITPDWLHREQVVGYVAYADRFAGTLRGVRERLPYLRELGVGYLHLMPLLRARPAPNDGGYAVADYGAVEPALGTMDDLRALAADLRGAGMALCVDVVLNHTAREHAWARAAMAGDARKLAYYRTFADRGEPGRLRGHAARGLPRHRAGQLHVGARARALGVDDVQRLPVGPRLVEPRGVRRDGRGRSSASRRPASTCCASTRSRSSGSGAAPTARTSPRCTSCVQALRAAVRIAAPGSRSRPRRSSRRASSSRYLGAGQHEGKECDLAYHNVLMVLLWSALASRRVRS